jgi:hypothetical protein
VDNQRRWMNSEQAADYCGVNDRKYFLKLAKAFNLPRYGHSRRMFDRFDLDRWMVDKKSFLPQNPTMARRRPGGFVPIHNVLTQITGEGEPEDPEDNRPPADDELKHMLALRKQQAVFRLDEGDE